ncbi:ABC transporter permease [Actinomadura macrotermitis]|uniref:Oligopeptide transport system permease protein OppC n=1 Tax=Actinomadura macrotermitis TaxID=2585200 RepID=A0A7K0C5D4_9ACTN|nr:ABC transporter permease [Actinomadura macrotermitis]MQY08649.1 Oligopeptide transport system permease protein OppC [Actinomadura macrotermitis]
MSSFTELDSEIVPVDAEPRRVQGRTPWQLAWTRFRRDRLAVASLVVLALMVVFAALAPLWAHWTGHPYDATFPKTALDPSGQPVGPGRHFWLGADQLGRDVLVRAAYGARISLVVGVAAAVLASVIGVAVGVLAGFVGGVLDTVLARMMDITLALPYLLVAIMLATTFQLTSVAASVSLTIVVIAFFSFAAFGRIIRGQVLSLREKEFIEAARSLGAGNLRIMAVDVLPNLMAQVTVLTSLLIPTSIVFEATLSFLGVGVRLPMPSWGSMLGEGSDVFQTAWWLLAVPAFLLLLTTLSFNLLGDGIRDALDPRGDRHSGKK